MTEWFDVKIKPRGFGRTYFPQNVQIVSPEKAKDQGIKAGRYFHVMQDGYRWIHESRIEWKKPRPDKYLDALDPLPPERKPKAQSAPKKKSVVESLDEDWRQIFVKAVKK